MTAAPFILGKVNKLEVVAAESANLNGYVSEWNYTVNFGSTSAEPFGVAVDSQNNIIAVGYSANSTNSSYTYWNIMKFDKDGHSLWNYTRGFGTANEANAVAVDHANNIIVVGYDDIPGRYEWRILKLSSEGTYLWNASHIFSSGPDQALAVAVDSNNNITVVGSYKASSLPSDYGWAIVKLDKDGNYLWNITSNFSPGNDVAVALAIDNQDNNVVAGRDNVSGNLEWKVMKYDEEGNYLCNYTNNFGSPNPSEPGGVTVDSDNNIIVVGYDMILGLDRETKVIKLDANCNHIWDYANNAAQGFEHAWDVAADSFNNITVLGYYNASAPADYGWQIIKLGYDGAPLWFYRNDISNGNDQARAVVIDKNDDSMVAVGSDLLAGSNLEWRMMKFQSLSSRVHNLNTGLNYATIQEAIDSNETLDGHTILVDVGTYYENVVVNKSLSIVGENGGYTLQGLGDGTGFSLSGVTNVTIENATIANFTTSIALDSSSGNILSGNSVENIVLDSSSGNTLSGNNVTGNSIVGIALHSSSGNNLSGNNVANYIYGILLGSSSGNTLSGNNVTNNWDGIYLDYSSDNNVLSGNNVVNNKAGFVFDNSSDNNVLSGNNIAANNYYGINLASCSGNTLSGNNITANNDYGIYLDNCSGNILSGNNVANSSYGIWLMFSSGNTLSGNNVTANIKYGIELASCSGNTLSGNNITANNGTGIWLYHSSGNIILHNSFVNNTARAVLLTDVSNNTWDDGYPSGGNYWKDYNGTDLENGPYQNATGSDGIGDTAYVIAANNTDNYPLMGMFLEFNTTSELHVQTVSNSTVTGFQYNGTALNFSVSGEDDSIGFCRICIPRALLNETYKVYVNGTEIPYRSLPFSNSTHSYLYFNYTLSTEQVTIVPEFPSFLVLPLFLMTTLLAVIGFKARARREQSKIQ
jgi:parallel beta-helix repeat protein